MYASLKANNYQDLRDMHGYADRGQKVNPNLLIGNNTRSHLITGPLGDHIYVSLHGHKIVCLFPNGNIGINMCGWGTVTTRGRINTFLPRGYSITQTNHRQYLTTPTDVREVDAWAGWYVIDMHTGEISYDGVANREATYV